MPQFNAYPALRAQTFDLPEIMRQAQQLQGQRTQNKLREFQMRSAQAEQHRGAQLREIMPGVGAEAGLGPKAQQALELDPSQLNELLKIPKAQRDQARQKVEQIADLLAPLADPSVPELQKAQMYPQILQRAQQLDLPVDKAPQTYDPNWVAMTRAEAGKYKNALDQADKAFTLSPGQTRYGPGGKPIASMPKSPSDEDAFGKGMEGQAYNALLEYKAYVDAGQTPPPSLVDRARVAQHTLNKRRFFRDPEGNLLSYTPGIPQGFPTPDQQPRKTPEPGQEGAPSPTGGLRTEIEAKPKIDTSLPLTTMRKISKLLNAPGDETITGVVGTAKRLGGGLARQAGIPVSAKAERLQRLLETLQGQMGPIILNEKRLSETERERLERIVGDVSPTMDEQSLRSALADLLDFIAGLEGS